MNGFIQVIETCETVKEANALLNVLSARVGFKNGYVYFDASRNPKRYVCEAFFDPKVQLARLGLAELVEP